MKPENKDKSDSMDAVTRYGHLGITIGVIIFLFSYLGNFLDQKFQKAPLFTIIFFLWGFIGSFVYLLRIAKETNDDKQQK